jgi:hypothetical protein
LSKIMWALVAAPIGLVCSSECCIFISHNGVIP